MLSVTAEWYPVILDAATTAAVMLGGLAVLALAAKYWGDGDPEDEQWDK